MTKINNLKNQLIESDNELSFNRTHLVLPNHIPPQQIA